MGFIASDNGGGNFKRVPGGVHIGRCYAVIDLGTQTETGNFGTSKQHKIRICWELFGEDENGEPLVIEIDGERKPMTISKKYTLSLGKKANLRKDLEQWRGRAFSDEEVKGFDVSKLLGAFAMVNCTESETNGKTYTNVSSLSPLPAALKHSKPLPVHKDFIFDLDAPDVEIFNSFHDKLRETIEKSPEWQFFIERQMSTPNGIAPNSGSSATDFPDDIPF